MYFLVRRVIGRGAGESLEQDYQGDRLTIGYGALVQLPGLQGQIALTPHQQGAAFETTRLQPLLAGKATRKGKLALGDVLELPGYEIELILAPSGFDLAVEVRLTSDKPAVIRTGLELDDSAFNIRRMSWLLAVTVLALFLVIPAASLFDSRVASTLRQAPLPDDGLWSSGPLASAHRTAGVTEDCGACHQEPFVMVRDDACLDCHRNTREHVDLEIHDSQAFVGERCASCHREHNEPAHIVDRNKSLCTDCHADPEPWAVAGGNGMGAVSAFTGDQHPAFRLALLRPQGPGAAHGWRTERVSWHGDNALSEQSNLKFNHQVHLDADKVQDQASGQPLACSACHVLKEDGEHFEPVTMDNHCRSCHSLNFDVFEPDLELPHGDTRAAIVAMEAHFIREFTDPVLRKDRAAQKPRRVPGKRYASAACEGSGLECGRAEAMKEAAYQFVETGCITCHEVTETGLSDIADRWFVQPVRVTGDWYPYSQFNHTAHLSLAGGSEAEVCAGCHEAATSVVSTDTLIPVQQDCLACHDEQKGGSLVDCVACHQFHQPTGSVSILAREVSP